MKEELEPYLETRISQTWGWALLHWANIATSWQQPKKKLIVTAQFCTSKHPSYWPIAFPTALSDRNLWKSYSFYSSLHFPNTKSRTNWQGSKWRCPSLRDGCHWQWGIDLGGGMGGNDNLLWWNFWLPENALIKRTLKKCCQWQDLIAWLVFLTHCNDISGKIHKQGDLGRVG